jgi:hypothetical protein
MMRAIHSSSRRGSALILVLWCLLLLGMAVFGVVEMVELSVEHTSHEALALEARSLALSGLALGLNPQLLKDDPLLAQSPAEGRQFKATISSEGARLNLNFVLLSNHREILENLFTQWGMPVDQADHVADCLYDWVTPGDLPSLNGAKSDAYARANLAAVFSIDPGRVGFFTQRRNGKDGIPGTSDDLPVQNASLFQGQLGIGDATMAKLGSQISFNDPNRRVESVGQAQGTQVMISVVTRLRATPVQYFLWSEQ